MESKLTGLVAAPFTPMLEDESLNLGMIAKQAEALSSASVSGAFICGTTGEGMSLSTAERMLVAERWVKDAPKSLKIIVHVGHNSVKESCELAAHAEKSGAHAAATMGPNVFRSASVEQLVSYCAEVAGSAPKLPFYFYHMPSMTGLNFSMLDFLKTANGRIPNLAGIKYTHENLMDYSQCVHFENGKFNILFGRDEILLGALSLGATGAVGSTYNYIAPIYQRLIGAFKAGDLVTARKHQLASIEVISIMIRHGGLPAAKAIMKMIGIDCGPVRSPLQNLSSTQKDKLRVELEGSGLVEMTTSRPEILEAVAPNILLKQASR